MKHSFGEIKGRAYTCRYSVIARVFFSLRFLLERRVYLKCSAERIIRGETAMRNLNYNIISNLSERFGDAFYLLDSDQFKENYRNLSKSFSGIYPHFNIAYSYKTNYIPKLCKIINEMGGYAEVVSDMEMEIALRAGVHPSKIIWNGPVKNMSKAGQLLLTGGTVNIDSVFELDFIKELALSHPGHTVNVGIRCNFDVGDGVISRFGIDVDSDDFKTALSFVKKYKNIRLINLQCHFAKRDVGFWPARAKGMLDAADRAIEEIGYIPERIDIGGGLYGNMPEDLKKQFSSKIPSYDDYAVAAATLFKEHFPDNKPELLIEPGSAIVGDCMKFIGKVETVKTVRRKIYVTMMGSQKNISMCGVNPPMEVIHGPAEKIYYENADIVGYTCIEGDVMYHGYTGDLAIGDYLVFSNCGSYSVVMKPPFIMPNFPVLDICGEHTEVIKREECFDDLFHTFAF